MRLATVSLRARRRLSARARPRPSATASAKVANSTVSHSQAAIANANQQDWPVASSRTPSTVTRTATISVTKITGLRINPAGLSFLKLSPAARRRIAPSNSAIVSALLCAIVISLEGLAGVHREMLRQRTERLRGQELQAAENEDHAGQQADE